jgi:hypothetical protein
MGATSIYMATVTAQHRALVQHHYRQHQSHSARADLCCESLPWRHLGLIPLFIAVQNAAMDAPSPTM